jgi:hypothetical protein
MIRIYILVAALTFWPSLAHAQAKDAFVEGLTRLINAMDGTYGDATGCGAHACHARDRVPRARTH